MKARGLTTMAVACLALAGLPACGGGGAGPAADCSRLPPLPTPPQARQVSDFGAIADDDLPDDDAINRALAALRPGDWLVFAPGRYIQAHSVLVSTPGVTLWGPGATLHASDPADHTLGLRADGVRVYGFRLTAATDQRRSAAEQARISVYRDWRVPGLQSGNVVRGVTIAEGGTPETAHLSHSAGSAGILVSAASGFTIADNTVRRTLADGIHITGGSRGGRVVGNVVRETGDDLIAVVSYLGNGWQARLDSDAAWRAQVLAGTVMASDIVVQGNDVADNGWGRGIAVVGSRNISVLDNRITGTRHGAGVLVAQEGGYATPGPRNVLVQGNAISQVQTTLPAAQAGTTASSPQRSGHAAIELHAIQNSAEDAAHPLRADVLRLQGVQIADNTVSGAGADGVRIGASTLPGLIAGVSVVGNRLALLAGVGLRNVLADAALLYCAGNTLDGSALAPACTLSPAPVVSGAALDCSTLP